MKPYNTIATTEFFQMSPTHYGELVNEINQKFQMWEHPIEGEYAPVMLSYELEDGSKLLFNSGFRDVSDLSGEYAPVMMDGELFCMWEYYKTLPQNTHRVDYMFGERVLTSCVTTSHELYIDYFMHSLESVLLSHLHIHKIDPKHYKKASIRVYVNDRIAHNYTFNFQNVR